MIAFVPKQFHVSLVRDDMVNYCGLCYYRRVLPEAVYTERVLSEKYFSVSLPPCIITTLCRRASFPVAPLPLCLTMVLTVPAGRVFNKVGASGIFTGPEGLLCHFSPAGNKKPGSSPGGLFLKK
jgi:hypothetical protein